MEEILHHLRWLKPCNERFAVSTGGGLLPSTLSFYTNIE